MSPAIAYQTGVDVKRRFWAETRDGIRMPQSRELDGSPALAEAIKKGIYYVNECWQ
jgi:hypothetical protein